jgi:uncharacterized protein involved in response to NO
MLSILSVAAFALLSILPAPALAAGLAALAAALLNSVRLYLWRGWSTRGAPIVWVLHLGYAWVVVGLGLAAAAALSNAVPVALAAHAFGTGAGGTMILAVMSRAALGHTGRPLVVARPVVWAYLLVTLAAFLRVVAPLIVPQHYPIVLTASAVSWIAAFALFTVVYAPILTTPRVHMKAGGA